MRLLTPLAGIALAACSQVEPVIYDCDRILIGKYGTTEEPAQCRPPMPRPYILPPGVIDDPHDPTMPPCDCPDRPQEPPTEPPYSPPPTPPEPPEKPPHEPPTERQKGNNGLGNGDQRAPGGSLDRNKAENDRGIGVGSHRSGKSVRAN